MKLSCHFICHSLAEKGDISMIFSIVKEYKEEYKNVPSGGACIDSVG